MSIKQCPFCAEDIDTRAIKCKHCGSMLDNSTPPAQSDGEVFRRKIIDEVEERNKVKQAYKIESYKNVGIKVAKVAGTAIKWYLFILAFLLLLGLLATIGGR
jgi:hypothetical protein